MYTPSSSDKEYLHYNLYTYLAVRAERDPNTFVSSAELLSEYRRWCRQFGLACELASIDQLEEAMRSLGRLPERDDGKIGFRMHQVTLLKVWSTNEMYDNRWYTDGSVLDRAKSKHHPIYPTRGDNQPPSPRSLPRAPPFADPLTSPYASSFANPLKGPFSDPPDESDYKRWQADRRFQSHADGLWKTTGGMRNPLSQSSGNGFGAKPTSSTETSFDHSSAEFGTVKPTFSRHPRLLRSRKENHRNRHAIRRIVAQQREGVPPGWRRGLSNGVNKRQPVGDARPSSSKDSFDAVLSQKRNDNKAMESEIEHKRDVIIARGLGFVVNSVTYYLWKKADAIKLVPRSDDSDEVDWPMSRAHSEVAYLRWQQQIEQTKVQMLKNVIDQAIGSLQWARQDVRRSILERTAEGRAILECPVCYTNLVALGEDQYTRATGLVRDRYPWPSSALWTHNHIDSHCPLHITIQWLQQQENDMSDVRAAQQIVDAWRIRSSETEKRLNELGRQLTEKPIELEQLTRCRTKKERPDGINVVMKRETMTT